MSHKLQSNSFIQKILKQYNKLDDYTVMKNRVSTDLGCHVGESADTSKCYIISIVQKGANVAHDIKIGVGDTFSLSYL